MVDMVSEMNNILITGDKAVKIRMEDLSEDAWTYLVGGSEGGDIQEYFKSVAWLYRGVTVRAQTVASMPFAVMRGETELVVSDDYNNDKIKAILPHPKRVLQLIEAALTLLGYAYLEKTSNLVGTKTMGLRWLVPTSIQPKFTEEAGLVGFVRGLKNDQVIYKPDELLYFWSPDPFVEIGPPKSSPAKAAIQAAGVLNNVDRFVEKFFDRGAIKATVLGVPTGTPQAARDELKTWWEKVISGINNAFAARVIQADTVSATVIGEGIQELSNVELTTEKRQDISTALGIPQSILFSDAANFAVAKEDNLHFYDKTIVPECNFIEGILNEQIFDPMGMRWEFRPETLDIMQEDEKERAMALGYLVNATMPLDMALRILGFELSDKDWAQLEQEKLDREERAEEMAERLQGGNNGGGVAFQPEDPKEKPDPFIDRSKSQKKASNFNAAENMRSDLGKWQEKAENWLQRGKPEKGRKFESDYIPETLGAAISGALEETHTEDEIRQVFSDIWMGYP